MEKPILAFAKIVATPTFSAWSQAYNAGTLFAVLSLSLRGETENETSLSTMGKELLNRFEQEYFTLEEKNLLSIKKAMQQSVETVDETLILSFVVCAFIKDVVYIVICGSGKVIVAREQKIAIITHQTGQYKHHIKAFSGFAKDNDIFVLQTEEFTNLIPHHILNEYLAAGTPSDIAEHLAPKIHEKEEGAASAVIVSYKNALQNPPEELEEKVALDIVPTRLNESPVENEKTSHPKKPKPFFLKTLGQTYKKFNLKKLAILIVSILILFILITNIVKRAKLQQQNKNQALFDQIYQPAQKKFDEGNALIGLNKNLAFDDYSQAKKMLEDGKNKLPAEASQQKQIDELLARVNEALKNAPSAKTLSTQPVDAKKSPLLGQYLSHPQALFVSEDDNAFYILEGTTVSRIDKGNNTSKQIINGGIDDPAGLGVFGSNMYILDKKKNQILKFVPSDYTASNYLSSGVSADLTHAKDIAIDGSIYVLLPDSIIKFTRGKGDPFTLSGLDKPFSNPSRIVTSIDDNSLYILDLGNNRIVQLAKNGAYQNSFVTDTVKSAKAISVDEPNKKLYLLSGSQISELTFP